MSGKCKRGAKGKKGKGRASQGKNKSEQEKNKLEAQQRVEDEKKAKEEAKKAEKEKKAEEAKKAAKAKKAEEEKKAKLAKIAEMKNEPDAQEYNERIRAEQVIIIEQIRQRAEREARAEQERRRLAQEERLLEMDKNFRQKEMDSHLTSLISIAKLTLIQRRKELEQRAKLFILTMTEYNGNNKQHIDSINRMVYEQGFFDGRLQAMKDNVLIKLRTVQSAFVGFITNSIIEQQLAEAEKAFTSLIDSSHEFSAILNAHLNTITRVKKK